MHRRDRGAVTPVLLASFMLVFTVITVWMWFSREWRPAQMSVHSKGVDKMITYIVGAAGFIFIIGHLVLSKFIMNRSKPDGQPWKPMSHGAETFFTIAPVILMVLVSEIGTIVIGAPVWNEVYTHEPGDVEVEITGMQYEWVARYAGADGKWGKRVVEKFDSADNPLALDPKDKDGKDDIVSRGVVYLPAGKPVWFNIRSWDVLHSFNIPEFRTKQDAVPGIYTHTRVTPLKPTENGKPIEVACAEICNFGHYKMKAKVIVKTPEDFAKWLETTTKFGD